MNQENLEERLAALERANAQIKCNLAEAKAEIQAVEKDVAVPGKPDESGMRMAKAEIERKLASIEYYLKAEVSTEKLKSELASMENVKSEVQMANAVQKKQLAEEEALDKQLAAMNVEAECLETEQKESEQRLLEKLDQLKKELIKTILDTTAEIDMLIKEGLEANMKNLDKIVKTSEGIRAREKAIKENRGKIGNIDKDIEKGFEAIQKDNDTFVNLIQNIMERFRSVQKNIVLIDKEREELLDRMEQIVRDLKIQKPENAE